MLEAMMIGGLIGVALVIWFAVWFFKTASDQSREAKENAPKVLDELFNGDEVVTYTSGFANLDLDTVVKGGVERGYELYTKGGRNSYGMEKLVFRKQSS